MSNKNNIARQKQMPLDSEEQKETTLLDLEFAIQEIYKAGNILYLHKLIDRTQSMKFDSLVTHLQHLFLAAKSNNKK
jgi:hypothetical protein